MLLMAHHVAPRVVVDVLEVHRVVVDVPKVHHMVGDMPKVLVELNVSTKPPL
jgi:hypothetical protein